MKQSFSVERKFWKLFGATVRTYSPDRDLICRAEQKAFKLREYITFYRDEERTQPLFSIRARTIIDLGVTFDIFSRDSQEIVASIRRKGIRSTFVRDEWLVLDTSENPIAIVQEESSMLGLIRRYIELVSLVLPQKFLISIDGSVVATIQQNRNPLTVRLQCEYDDVAANQLGETLVYAIPNLIAIIEQRQH